jgi:hypothetical protein
MTVPAEPPQAVVELAAPQKAAPAVVQQAKCPACGQAMAAKAVVCGDCGYDLRSGRKVTKYTPPPGAATATPAPVPTHPASVATRYPMSRRPSQEEPAGSTTKYVILGGILLLVAMGVGGWIIFNGTGGGDANKPKLGDDAAVERMIADEYPKDLTEWVQANPARMLGGMNAMQAAMMEKQLKKMGATKVLAFGAGVLCLVIAVELPDDPAQRTALIEWHDQNLLPGSPGTKDVGQRYFLHYIGL